MNFVKWFKTGRNVRCKALLLYERGMAKAKKQEQQSALAEYSSAIERPAAPNGVVSKALR